MLDNRRRRISPLPEETTRAGSGVQMIPEQTHRRTVQQVSTWAAPDHQNQPHYQETKEAQIQQRSLGKYCQYCLLTMALIGTLASLLSDIGGKSKQKKPKEMSAVLQVQSRSRNLQGQAGLGNKSSELNQLCSSWCCERSQVSTLHGFPVLWCAAEPRPSTGWMFQCLALFNWHMLRALN